VAATGAADEQVVPGRGTVLVVDDDEAVLEACASILAHLNYTPLSITNGRRAIEIFTSRASEIDLVILDLILPDMSGGEVFDALRSIDPGVKVLLSSGYSIDGQAEEILKRGCDDFIQKPFTMEQLSHKVRVVLGRGR